LFPHPRPGSEPKESQREYEPMIERRPFGVRWPSREVAGHLARHGAAVAHERSGFAVPLRVDPIDRILEHRGGSVIVFRCYEYESIRCRDLSGPFLHHLMLVRWASRHRWRHWLVEEGHGKVAEVEKPHFNPLPFTKLLKNPLSRLFGKPALTCAADDY